MLPADARGATVTTPRQVMPARARRPFPWAALILGAGAAGLLGGLDPRLAGVVPVAALVAAVAARPVVAAYLWLGVTPLIVGIDRGRVLPLLRPNEALLIVLCIGVAAAWLIRWIDRREQAPVLTRVDLGFVLLAVTGSGLPLLWTFAQGRGVGLEDILSAANVAKYLLVYLLVRVAVSSAADIQRCLWVSLCSGAVVAVLAVLQALDAFGAPALLAMWFTPFAEGRGSATIGQSQGLADVMVFNLAITIAMILHGRTSRLLLAAAALFLVGALASGQVSGVIGLVVGVLAVGYVLGQLPRVLRAFLIISPLAAAALAPVIAARLASVDPQSGVPRSWEGRWHNLTTYFWPRVFDESGWLLGVQLVPQAVGKEVWQPTVYIESGHTWLLWIGGVPFLLAFIVFVLTVLRASSRVARTHTGAVGVAGAATFAAWWTINVGMLFDPHLFMRGSADLSFPLLALTVSGAAVHAAQTSAGRSLPVVASSAPPAGPARSVVARGRAATPTPRLPVPAPRSPGGLPRPARVLAAVVVVAALAALTVNAHLQSRQGATPAPPTFDRVLVISGSALAAGTPSAAAAAAERLGAVGVSHVVSGAGYTRNTTGGPSLVVDVLTLQDLAAFDVVVVQGGEADAAAPAPEITTSTLRLIDHLQAQAPSAALVLVGPLASEVPPPAALSRVTDVVRAAAATRGVSFIDAGRYGWSTADPRLAERLADTIAPPAASAPGPRTLVVSGSSLVAGSRDTAQQAADLLGAWGVARVFHRAGFARSAPGGSPPLTQQLREMPDLASFDTILVQGGEADNVASVEELTTAALHLVDYVDAVAPSARLVLVGPIPAELPAPASMVRVSQNLRAAAESRGVAFVNPIEAAWTDRDAGLGPRLAVAAQEVASGRR